MSDRHEHACPECGAPRKPGARQLGGLRFELELPPRTAPRLGALALTLVSAQEADGYSRVGIFASVDFWYWSEE